VIGWEERSSSCRARRTLRDDATRFSRSTTLEGVRKRSGEEALSTFEAIARALSILEGRWVEQQMMPVLRVLFERSRLAKTGGYGR
jgi:hypothetical protein